MTLTELKREYDKHHEQFDCKHENKKKVVRQRVNGGSCHYVFQCTHCGARASNAIKREEAHRLANGEPSEFDEDLRAKYEACRQQSLDEIARLRKQKNTEWWNQYNEYLKSPEWAEKRQKVLRRDNYICQGCLEAAAAVVHHRSYAHAGDELLYELISLCGPCHEKAHMDDEGSESQ